MTYGEADQLAQAIRVPCSCCEGTGRAPLFPVEIETYRFLVTRDDLTARELRDLVGGRISVTAMNNRLEALRTLGLATRRRDGKRWIYSATDGGAGGAEGRSDG